MDAKVVTGLNGNDMHAIWDEFAPEMQQEGDKTVAELALHWKCSVYAANIRLVKMIKAGHIRVIDGITTTGRKGLFYRPVKGE